MIDNKIYKELKFNSIPGAITYLQTKDIFYLHYTNPYGRNEFYEVIKDDRQQMYLGYDNLYLVIHSRARTTNLNSKLKRKGKLSNWTRYYELNAREITGNEAHRARFPHANYKIYELRPVIKNKVILFLETNGKKTRKKSTKKS